MIPKVIHYCWFGGGQFPEITLKCIESWKKYCPDYEIRLWNENNFDFSSCDYAREAYEEKQWAFASDYARLKIIYDNGGVYLDTDVELIKSLDPLLRYACFLGTEPTGYIATGLGFGAEKNNAVIKKMLDEYKGAHFRGGSGVFDIRGCPDRNTKALARLGFCYTGKIWQHEDIVVFPAEYFCPINRKTGKETITDKTYSIHHYTALWINEADREQKRKIQEIVDGNNAFVAKIKAHKFLYEELKNQGKATSFLGYLKAKAFLLLHNRI